MQERGSEGESEREGGEISALAEATSVVDGGTPTFKGGLCRSITYSNILASYERVTCGDVGRML
jgi:hypothetical protein